ncbi:putative toxin-antitoxin system toxin component, PIN family [Rhodoferax lacus]|uniref:putative toxin-antitoxin system toxin component, PIN family n=1 Tax=Rhodoferax lacus TaxID=2184758 RepID=UPI001F3B8461|nr:putative toxin-antitoxin system toxin component, PIN family [Rhodoferax lacus]
MPSATSALPVRAILLDTNIVLDLFVFNDPATPALLQALQGGSLRWIASQPMRDELERVLAYTHIVPRLAFYQLSAADVLQRFDAMVQIVDVAPKVQLTCKDPDDQKFIDLAVAHQAVLLSKDHAVLALAKRMRPFGVQAQKELASAEISQARPSLQ